MNWRERVRSLMRRVLGGTRGGTGGGSGGGTGPERAADPGRAPTPSVGHGPMPSDTGVKISVEAEPLPSVAIFADVIGADVGHVVVAGNEATVAAVRVGRVSVSRGALAACDPVFDDASLRAFKQRVPRGVFPVVVLITAVPRESGGVDEHIAFARVVFAERPVARWVLALRQGDPSKLKSGEYVGYPVDSGMGCFLDPDAAERLGTELMDEMTEALNSVGRDNVSCAWLQAGGRELVWFSTGRGDGVYPTFVGRDEHGEVVALMTDFLLVDWPGGIRGE